MSNGQGPDVDYDPSPLREFGPAEGTAIQNIASGELDMTLSFPSPILELGFEMRTFTNVAISLTFFSGNETLQTLSVPTRTLPGGPLELYFYGFESDTPFDRVLVGIEGSARYNDYFEMDNLQFGVPEPSAPALLMLGVALKVLTRSHRPSHFRALRSPPFRS